MIRVLPQTDSSRSHVYLLSLGIAVIVTLNGLPFVTGGQMLHVNTFCCKHLHFLLTNQSYRMYSLLYLCE